MNDNMRKLSTIAVAVAVALGSQAVLAQDRSAQEVREAAENVERAEERLERAEDEFEQAIADAAEADRESSASSQRNADARGWDEGEWDALIDEHASLGTFVEALRLTGLDDTLTSGTQYTVFAPNDEAFEDRREELFREENRDELVELLRAHIVADDVDPDRARDLQEALTVDGGTIDLAYDDGELRVGDARVVERDISRDNLRIYVIDDVLDTDVAVAFRDDSDDARDDDGEFDFGDL